jgi:hypothetical protein
MLRDMRPTLETMREKREARGVGRTKARRGIFPRHRMAFTVANLIECRGFQRKKSGGGQGSMIGASAMDARAPGGNSAGGLHCQPVIIQD